MFDLEEILEIFSRVLPRAKSPTILWKDGVVV